MADGPLSPYAPGYGVIPPLLAGRDDVFSRVERSFAKAAAGRTPPVMVLPGARGFGKTVLLREIGRRATGRGWPVVHVEARSGVPLGALLAQRCGDAAEQQRRGRVMSRLRPTEGGVHAHPAGVGVEAKWSSSARHAVDPAGAAIRAYVERSAKRHPGAFLAVDEAQLAKRDGLEALGATLQEGAGEGWPLVVVIAGLPSLEAEDNVPTYISGRADWVAVGPLDDKAVIDALAVPAEQAGRPFDPDAARMLAAKTAGYPYAVQLSGEHAWDASHGQPVIGMDAARAAADETEATLQEGHDRLLRRAAPGERAYLAAVSACLAEDGHATGGTVAAKLGRTASEMSSTRARLLDRGTLFATDEELAFSVPGMQEYVARTVDPPTPRARRSPGGRPTASGRTTPAGCSPRCWTSVKTADGCRCVCKGASHGQGAQGKIPAADRHGRVLTAQPG